MQIVSTLCQKEYAIKRNMPSKDKDIERGRDSTKGRTRQ